MVHPPIVAVVFAIQFGLRARTTQTVEARGEVLLDHRTHLVLKAIMHVDAVDILFMWSSRTGHAQSARHLLEWRTRCIVDGSPSL